MRNSLCSVYPIPGRKKREKKIAGKNDICYHENKHIYLWMIGEKILHRIVINKLGPISYCELKCSDFLTFTGFQASGKSTIAKAIYFFRTVKEDILNISVKQAVDAYQSEKSLRRRLELSYEKNSFEFLVHHGAWKMICFWNIFIRTVCI